MSKNTFGGINGSQKNKVGSVVGYKFRGEQVYRGYQKNVANPRTTAQVNNRTRFAKLSSFARVLSVPINIGYAMSAKGTMMTPRNMQMSENKGRFDVGGNMDYMRVTIAKGNLLRPAVRFSTPGEAYQVTLAVNNSPYATGSNSTTDKLRIYYVVFCPSMGGVVVANQNLQSTITTGSITVTCPESWLGEFVKTWMFVCAKDDDIEDENYGFIARGTCSDSIYTGEIEVQ